MDDRTMRDEEVTLDFVRDEFMKLQDYLVDFVERESGEKCHEDKWNYHKGAGGGRTRVWENEPSEKSNVFMEKGGINFSCIQGQGLPPSATDQMKKSMGVNIPPNEPFWATGVSIVLHPANPYVPSLHMNVRYFECGDAWWFAGGMDLTPYYPLASEVAEYHRTLKTVCDNTGFNYAELKSECDTYFTLPHRNVMRGVGGLFAEQHHMKHQRAADFKWCLELGKAMPLVLKPFFDKYKSAPFSPEERDFQLFRRSQYVEFNLLFDRGTKFGMQTGGRVESILMSLPKTARWRYNWQPEAGTREALVYQLFLLPQDWINMPAERVQELDKLMASPHAAPSPLCILWSKLRSKQAITAMGSMAFAAAVGFAVGREVGRQESTSPSSPSPSTQ